MKEEVLRAYRVMQDILKKHEYKTKLLEKDTVFKYKNRVFSLEKGTSVLDCNDNELIARIIIMDEIINKAYKKGIITSQDLIGELSGEDNTIIGIKKKINVQTEFNFN